MKNLFRLALLTLCAIAPLRECHAAFLIRDGKLQTDLNANTNRITNATDFVTAAGVSLSNLAAQVSASGATQVVYIAVSSSTNYIATSSRTGQVLFVQYCVTNGAAGGGSGTLTNGVVQGQAIATLTNNGALFYLTFTGATELANFTVATSALWSAISARLASNVWAAADSTTNYVRRTGGDYYASSQWNLYAPNGTDFLSIGNGQLVLSLLSVNASYLAFDSSGFSLFNAPFVGNGSGLTGLNGASITNLTAGSITNILAGNGISVSSGSGPQVTVALSNGFTLAGGITITAGAFTGNGSGLTNVNARTLDGFTGSDITSNTVKIVATPPFSAVTTSAGGTNTTTISATLRMYQPRDSKGDLDIGWTDSLVTGVDLVSAHNATNDIIFARYATTPSTTTKTNTYYFFSPFGITGVVTGLVRASQASGVFVFTARDGNNASAAITQTVAAADTTYTTNLPLAITALYFSVEARIQTTNSANLYQAGVDLR